MEILRDFYIDIIRNIDSCQIGQLTPKTVRDVKYGKIQPRRRKLFQIKIALKIPVEFEMILVNVVFNCHKKNLH